MCLGVVLVTTDAVLCRRIRNSTVVSGKISQVLTVRKWEYTIIRVAPQIHDDSCILSFTCRNFQDISLKGTSSQQWTFSVHYAPPAGLFTPYGLRGAPHNDNILRLLCSTCRFVRTMKPKEILHTGRGQPLCILFHLRIWLPPMVSCRTQGSLHWRRPPAYTLSWYWGN